jgi:hypothetical protein
MIESPKDKIGILYIHYRPHKELEDMRTFLKYGGPCGMATTAYTIEGSYMYLFITRFMSLFYEGLSLGVGHADEQIMTYLFDRYPDMFTIHYGDYKSTFQNYHMIHDDYHAVRWFFIEQAYKNGKHELAKYAADNVLESIEKGTLQIPHEHIQFLEMLRELY